MILILDDTSLCGQFEDIDSFADYLTNNLLCVLQDASSNGDVVYKDEGIIYRNVTPAKTLLSVIYQTGNPVFTRMKSFMVQMIDRPYLDDDSKYDEDSCYYCDGKLLPKRNCYTEAIDRQGDVWIFDRNAIDSKNLRTCVGKKDSVEWTMYLPSDYRSFLNANFLKISTNFLRKCLDLGLSSTSQML